MSNYAWAKVWIEVIYDHKMANLSDRLWRRTIELILLAKELDPLDGYLPCVDEMAFKLRTDPATLDGELHDLVPLGITKLLDNGGWFLPNFKDRQRKMTGAERVAMHRERRKRQEYNEPETEVLRDGNDTVTNRYTSQEKEPYTGEGNDTVTTRYREESRIEQSKSKNRTEESKKETRPDTPADYQMIRQRWIEAFPEKPKPRTTNKTLQSKVKTRLKASHFRDNWLAALNRAAQSEFLKQGDWFTLGWFLKNDDHYEKCLNGNYDDKDRRNGQHASEPAGFAGVRAIQEEIDRGKS